jgi:acid phosphatase family membrane protein YuiD
MTAIEAVLAVVLTWFSASVLKGLLTKESVLDGFQNGGMPSSHSATATALAVLFYLQEGTSQAFFLAVYVAIIVGTDAVKVRKTLERQIRQVNELLEARGEEPMEVVEGHTQPQVWAGVALGAVVAAAVYYSPADQLLQAGVL